MNRGDVLLARFPHPLGGRGKKRPVVVVQSDAYRTALRTLRGGSHEKPEHGKRSGLPFH